MKTIDESIAFVSFHHELSIDKSTMHVIDEKRCLWIARATLGNLKFNMLACESVVILLQDKDLQEIDEWGEQEA